ncbi:ATP-binding cassette domain-containing protein [Terracoccus luteus]|jgi:ABC-2 type transport system ATP-binding protein|uniref:ABC-2 type transport system ATP-binding protein n=1 Tax=Terracoccus luteus TaxID=53356 RepID=A0A839PX35_9MICO|nr:ATP-binding cassette domain-containing protein [Terracoccus luteus]MBB2986546.1 ABC-2 type transport system ATP-binding protein [Terracoccus luteus]MCP2171865.1 ABC-2 type transport system ATP-binding protein [Terracoccus luteus]
MTTTAAERDRRSRSSGPAIEAEHLVKRFGDMTAVDDVSFSVPQGSVLGLLGPNGAGKTTTVRMMTTLSRPTSGTARVAGHDVQREPDEVRRSMGLTGQAATVDELLTGRENLRLMGSLYGLSRQQVRRLSDELLERFSLTAAGDKVVKEYSGGMRRRLDLAVSLIAAPPVLFLDEPTTGLDPRSRVELWEVLRGLVRDGTTLLLTTQYLEEADQLADRIVVIDRGRIIAEGTPLQLKDQSGKAAIVLTVSHADQLEAARALLADHVTEVHVDEAARQLTAPAEGLSDMTRVAAVFERSQIELDDLGLQRPSLDDVFLNLTGHRAEDSSSGDPASHPAASPASHPTASATEEQR